MTADSDSTAEADPPLAPTLAFVAQILRQRLREATSQAGVSVSVEEVETLGALTQSPAPLRVGDLARQLVRDPTTISRQIDSLVKRHLVARTQSREDRRVVLVEATERGHNVCAEVHRLWAALSREVCRGIAGADLRVTSATVRQVQSNLLKPP